MIYDAMVMHRTIMVQSVALTQCGVVDAGTLSEHAGELLTRMEGHEGGLRKIFHHILHRHHDD